MLCMEEHNQSSREKTTRITNTLKVSSVRLAAVIMLAATVSTHVRAGTEIILHPGYIDGSVSIPDGAGGEYPIDRIYVYASSTDSEGNSHTSKGWFYGDEFTLTVEGGPWTYSVRIEAYYNGNSNNYVRWYRFATVGRGHTVLITCQTDSFIEGEVSVTGETVTYVRPQAQTYGVSSGDPQYGFFSRAQFFNGNYRLPILGGDATYRVYNTSVRLALPTRTTGTSMII